MQQSALPPLEAHHPATFRSRGVAAPFTTPLLAGARVRESKRAGVELVVPNPSGGRGVYIVQWPGVRSFCNPTVHDTLLFGAIARLTRINPVLVRDAALDVALGGYAGRDAIAAAETARGGDQVNRLLTDFLLLSGLIEEVEPTGRKPTRLAERTPDFDRRAGLVLRRIAPSIGCPAANLTNGLAALGEAIAHVGIRQDLQTTRVPRLIARLKETEADLARWLASDPGNDIGDLGRTVTTLMKVAAQHASMVLADLRIAINKPLALLKRWVTQPSDPIDLLGRCDWLLDGWERVCLLWKAASSVASRRAALLEMVQLVPILPREACDWIGGPIPSEAMDESCRVTSSNDVWRSGGAAIALIQRNEALGAMSW